MGAEFVRGRVCQGPSLLGAEMSRNRNSQLVKMLILLHSHCSDTSMHNGDGASLSIILAGLGL